MSAVSPNSPPLPDRANRPWARLRLAGLEGFWSWWLRALASWLPLRIQALFGLAQERLLLQRDGDSLRLALARGDARRELGQIPWSANDASDAPADPEQGGSEDPLGRLLAAGVVEVPRWLVLPAASGLRRRLTLPVAAVDRLRDVVAFEIERQTPFTTGDVHFDVRVVARRGDGQIEAELVAVPRATLDRALVGLGPLAGTLAGVDMATSDGQALGINLLPGAQRRRRSDPWAGWNWALAAVALIALAAGLWQMLDNRETAADAFEQTTTTHASQADRVRTEKKQLINLVEGMKFLQTTRAGRPTTVEVLDELSRRLPDSTYLEKLSIEDDRMLLIGLSSEASSLVQRLEGSKLWRAPALTGALQPDPRSGKDRFTLTAELAIAKQAQNKNQGAANARRNP